MICNAGRPSGPIRCVSLNPPPKRNDAFGGVWRDLDILTQRFRFSGRPIYNWASPAKLATPHNPVVPLTETFVEEQVYMQFEREAFFDRADSDADRVAVRLEPIMMQNPENKPVGRRDVLRVDWTRQQRHFSGTGFEMKKPLCRRNAGPCEALPSPVGKRLRKLGRNAGLRPRRPKGRTPGRYGWRCWPTDPASR